MRLKLPAKLVPVFTGEADIRGAKGGRGSAKTRSFALMTAVRAYMWAASGESGIVLCGRQFMNSLADSSMEEIKAAIKETPELVPFFDIGEKYIRTSPILPGRIDYAFSGLDRNIDSIKSKARVRLGWIDEAEPVQESAWSKLIPTLREEDSELWVTWNPESDESPTHKRFGVASEDSRTKIITLNWRDNPWFPDTLNRTRLKDQRERPDTYDHVWEGAFLTISDAIIFRNRVTVETFETPKDARFFHGADWGFSQDPTVLVRAFVKDDCLYIDKEVFGYQVELDETPALFDKIDTSRKWPIKADNARPETISHIKHKGFPLIGPADKWKGSVEDGIACLKSFSKIIVHPDCVHIAKEFRMYSYKVDRVTGDILPIVVDKWNHGIDALRYALDGYIKNSQPARMARFNVMAR
ncbi:MAG: phage terminase large subunit [Acidobacteriaceae bacterium]|nr:phage terminase large subunit [Acidobacteriaceae bacterium]